MTEAESWQQETEGRLLLWELWHHNLPDRKLRLLAIAFGRLALQTIPEYLVRESEDLVALAEAVADSEDSTQLALTHSLLDGLRTRADAALLWFPIAWALVTPPRADQHYSAWSHRREFFAWYIEQIEESNAWWDRNESISNLIREVVGNPYHSVTFSPECQTSAVLALAKQMYASRDFSAMPILADALQDAGCENDDILNHCRDANGVHVRGCWVVDLVLNKM